MNQEQMNVAMESLTQWLAHPAELAGWDAGLVLRYPSRFGVG